MPLKPARSDQNSFIKKKSLHVGEFRTFFALFSVAISNTLPAQAQTEPEVRAPRIEVKAQAPAEPSDLTGIEGVPIAQTPISAQSLDAQAIRAQGATRLSDLYALLPAVSDAYNASGYWDAATVRGFVLDNRANYRREGLPISAETSIGLFNKERVALLQGPSGLQAGTSVPGGLIDYRVKRPTLKPLLVLSAQTDAHGQSLLALDWSQRSGALSWRFNAQTERLNSPARNPGRGEHLAGAATWQITREAKLDLEFEQSRRAQASIPGLSLLGGGTPSSPQPRFPAADPRINLNAQPWTLPVVLRGETASLRYEHKLGTAWTLRVQAAQQKLHSDDRVAFPFGCFEASSGDYFADRYCPNGDADLYDYRSENERRRVQATQFQLLGSFETGPIQHQISVSHTRSSIRERYQDQAFNPAGSINIFAPTPQAPDPSLTGPNTNRDETSSEWAFVDAMRFTLAGQRFGLWLGARHTSVDRASVRTDGSRATAYQQSLTTPWGALNWRISDAWMVYASRSSGAESEVTPNRSRYINAGAALPARISWQTELGTKYATRDTQLQLAYFDIARPVASDIPVGTQFERRIDGIQQHRGWEFAADTLLHAPSRTRLQAAGNWIDAKRLGSSSVPDGTRPTNVPRTSGRIALSSAAPALAGWTLQAAWVAQGKREVLEDASLQLPAWHRWDLSASTQSHWAGAQWQWRIAIDNASNRRFFKESPYQFGHSYLFPAAPRTWRLGVDASF